MWIPKGYIAHIGEYPVMAQYLIYDEYNGEIIWTNDTNKAFVFSTKERLVEICKRFNIKDYHIRIVIMTDMGYNA